jgi:hypothetical protein
VWFRDTLHEELLQEQPGKTKSEIRKSKSEAKSKREIRKSKSRCEGEDRNQGDVHGFSSLKFGFVSDFDI